MAPPEIDLHFQFLFCSCALKSIYISLSQYFTSPCLINLIFSNFCHPRVHLSGIFWQRGIISNESTCNVIHNHHAKRYTINMKCDKQSSFNEIYNHHAMRYTINMKCDIQLSYNEIDNHHAMRYTIHFNFF